MRNLSATPYFYGESWLSPFLILLQPSSPELATILNPVAVGLITLLARLVLALAVRMQL